MEKLKEIKVWFVTHKFTAILATAIILILAGGVFAFQKITSKPTGPVEAVDLSFDAEGPYALTNPRRDGNAMILNLTRTGSYDSISYELAYTSNPDETTVAGTKITDDGEGGSVPVGGIDRGVVGNIDTKEKKGEYEQEILFGTCSKNVCRYHTGVTNAKLEVSYTLKSGQKYLKKFKIKL
mgnify:CR=1 FL=1